MQRAAAPLALLAVVQHRVLFYVRDDRRGICCHAVDCIVIIHPLVDATGRTLSKHILVDSIEHILEISDLEIACRRAVISQVKAYIDFGARPQKALPRDGL